MSAFKHHILVCTQDKPDGVPSCVSCGAKGLLEAFRARLQAAGLGEQVLLTGCGCLGLCERGPNVLIYPQGRWLTQVKVEQLDAIIKEHLLGESASPSRRRRDCRTTPIAAGGFLDEGHARRSRTRPTRRTEPCAGATRRLGRCR